MANWDQLPCLKSFMSISDELKRLEQEIVFNRAKKILHQMAAEESRRMALAAEEEFRNLELEKQEMLRKLTKEVRDTKNSQRRFSQRQ